MSNVIENSTALVESTPRTKPKQVIDHVDAVAIRTEKTAAKLGSNQIGKLISKWPNQSEVWPLVWSSGICAVLAGATGFYINYKIRNYMYMLHAGRLTTYIATAAFPTATAGLSHYIFVTNDIFERQDRCPICIQVKAGAMQAVSGVAYPCLIAPVIAYPILSKMGKSFKMPSIVTHPKDVFNFFREIYKPFSKYLLPMFALQAVVGMGLTYLQQDAYLTNVLPYLNPKVNSILKDIE